VAGGKHKNLKSSAAKMLEIRWSDELAVMAGLNTMSCKVEHDFCHKTEENQTSGQNIFKSNQTYSDLKVIIETGLQSWYDESLKASDDSLKNFTGVDKG
jgi:hypothetical protein